MTTTPTSAPGSLAPDTTATAATTLHPGTGATAMPTVPELLDVRAAASPNRAALIMPEQTLTYIELAEASRRAAAALLDLGVGAGDVVGVLTGGDTDTVVTILAAARIGAISLPINNRFRADELRHVIDNGDVRVLVLAPAFQAGIHAALPSLPEDLTGRIRAPEAPVLRRVVLLGGTYRDTRTHRDATRRDEVAELQARVRADDTFVMIYTSGTTSRPRGCLHTHAGYVQQGKEIAEALRLTPTDRFWTPLPFFHVGGYDVLLASLWAGCTMIHPGVFSPEVALDQLAQHRCTAAFPAFETIWLPVLHHPRFPDTDLSALRVVVNVGTPERMQAMQDTLPRAIQVSCTGSTESAGFCCIGSVDDPPDARARTAGRVNPGMQARIVDPDTGQPLPDGTPGEFVFRGVYRFRHYHRDPELTARRIDSDGWFHSGDQLVRDSEGRYSFLGRLSDLLKVGGENVSPAEVEDHLVTHPAVSMAQVVAAPDDHYGEVPAAFLLLHPGRQIDPDEIISYCLGAIATYKVPRYIFTVNEWPMSGTKIQKFVLRQRVAAHLRQNGITEAPRLRSRTPTTKS